MKMEKMIHTMSTSTESHAGGDHDHILRPRAVKPINPQIERALNQEGYLKVNGLIVNDESGGTSQTRFGHAPE
jgi:hypothetical protein